MMRFLIALIVGLPLGILANPAEARGRRGCANGQCSQPVASAPVASGETATAQGVANIMARLGRVGHWGGNRGYEGCGMAGTPAAAYSICCFANDPSLVTVDVGYAQRGSMFFCCRRYARR